MSEENSQKQAGQNQIPGHKTAEEAAPSFADRLARARKIVQLLEQGDIDLEAGARLYREAGDCLRFCRERLASVRNEIELLNGEILQAEDVLKQADKDEAR